MKCPRCQHENPAGSSFCLECGARLDLRCGSCGTDLPAGSKFCNKCGTAVGSPTADQPRFASPESYTPKHLAEKILTSKTTLEGERKQVTVLFADLKGSMELLADRDPEEARKLLDPVLEHMMEAVHRYEGTVNQVMGDGIMALFGAPLAHEDHAVRACYAALRMQETVKKYADEVRKVEGILVGIRVGLNSGEVVVRSIGSDLRMDYSAIGQTTHLAARMEQLADPGSILLAPHTLMLAEGFVQVRPLGPTTVKGLPAPIEVYELAGLTAVRSRLQAATSRGLSRFVGRDLEFAQLLRALDEAQQGRGQLVAVVGEPGVGKSRLTFELTQSHRLDGWLVLHAGSVSYGTATGYLPVIELLKTHFHVVDHHSPEEIREKLTSRILSLDRTLEGTLPALLALLDAQGDDLQWKALDPAQRRQRTLDAVRRLLLREAQVQPLLLILEDLHWMDSETQAFLETLVESLPTAKLLLLINYRPEYQHGWGSKTYYTQLRLDALPRESATELLQALLGADATVEPLKPVLIARTGGNPLFLEESVRTLVETGALTGERGAYHLARPLQQIQIPATVQAVLAARIDRLPPEEKSLLQSAAVIGKDVPLVLLEEIAELPAEALHRGLERIKASEFLYEASLFPDLEYTFKHALTHEVIYGSLLNDNRRKLHGRVVEAMERSAGSRFANDVGQLGAHALRAGLWDKTVRYLREAGARAAMRSAYREAVAYFEQALVALSHLPQTQENRRQAFTLRMELRPWLNPLGDYERVFQNLRETEALAEVEGDRRKIGMVAAFMADCARMTGKNRQAIEYGERAVALATELGDFELTVLARQCLGHAYHAVGNYRRAIALLTENVQSLQGDLMNQRFGAAALPAVFARAYAVFSLLDVGEFATAIRFAQEAVELAQTADTAHSQVIAGHTFGLAYLAKGELDCAIGILERFSSISKTYEIRLGTRLMASALGYTYALAGRAAHGAEMLEEAVRQARSLNAVFRYPLWLAWLAHAYLLAGRGGEALRTVEDAIERAGLNDETGHRAWALQILGEIRTDFGESAGEAAYQEALALAVELGMRPLVAHCHLGLGKLDRRTGKREQAQEHLTTATTMYRDMGMTYWLATAEAELGDSA
jgi:class 3 adenylate cyclase/tetratricopeptide (TPR) repeat protein